MVRIVTKLVVIMLLFAVGVHAQHKVVKKPKVLGPRAVEAPPVKSSQTKQNQQNAITTKSRKPNTKAKIVIELLDLYTLKPVGGIELKIPELNLVFVTDKGGRFGFELSPRFNGTEITVEATEPVFDSFVINAVVFSDEQLRSHKPLVVYRSSINNSKSDIIEASMESMMQGGICWGNTITSMSMALTGLVESRVNSIFKHKNNHN